MSVKSEVARGRAAALRLTGVGNKCEVTVLLVRGECFLSREVSDISVFSLPSRS